MFNESFSIRALLALPVERRSLPVALETSLLRPVPAYADAFFDDSNADTPDTPGPFACLPTMLRLDGATASAFSPCTTENAGPGNFPAQPAADPAADSAASGRRGFSGRRPTRAAQILACIHDSPAGHRFTFVDLRNMLPPGARSYSAVAKMLEFGFLVRRERGIYERTATLFFGDPTNRDNAAFAGLNLFTARCSSPSNRRR